MSWFRVDLGVVHPEEPGRYLAGVEADVADLSPFGDRPLTATTFARPRSKDLGWRILRVWSTDWWMDAAGALDRIDGQLRAALEEAARKSAVEQETAVTAADEAAEEVAPGQSALEPTLTPAVETYDEEQSATEEDVVSGQRLLRYADPVVSVASGS